MARIATLAALLATLLFLNHASAYKTTITTVEVDENDINIHAWRSEQSCEKKLKKVNLMPCEQHIIDRIRRQPQQQQPEEPGEEVITLRGRVYNHHGHEKLKQCCEELNKLNDERCQCSALHQIRQRQKGQMEGMLKERMQQELMKLPESCGLGTLHGCQLHGMDPML